MHALLHTLHTAYCGVLWALHKQNRRWNKSTKIHRCFFHAMKVHHHYTMASRMPRLIAGKYCYHTIIPGMVTHEDWWCAIGHPHGSYPVTHPVSSSFPGTPCKITNHWLSLPGQLNKMGKRGKRVTRWVLIQDSSDLFCTLGVMGGFMQPQGHLQAGWLGC